MYEGLFQSSTIPILEQVVNFSQARHTVLAGNIANLDTPGYRTRDLSVEDFQSRLRKAVETRHKPTGSVSIGNRTDERVPDIAKVAEDVETILYHDDSNVGVEYQVTEMVKNQMQHNLALTIMSNQMNLLETAISERVT
jgi:flagellar basal-body rod protein FlgB